MLHALYTLVVHGDYTPDMRPLLGEEDSRRRRSRDSPEKTSAEPVTFQARPTIQRV